MWYNRKNTYSRVEKPTTDSEKHPCVDRQTHAEAQGDEEDLGRIGSQVGGLRIYRSCIDDIRAAKCEEQEHERARKLGHHGDEVVLHTEWEDAQKRNAPRDNRLIFSGQDIFAFLPRKPNLACWSIDVHVGGRSEAAKVVVEDAESRRGCP
jgi:hypothetical protein